MTTNQETAVKRTERGWAGHPIVSSSCAFRRNTLLECGDERIVVSTVGAYRSPFDENVFEEIGLGRYYETMAFKAVRKGPYWDADVSEQVDFDSEWAVARMTDDADQRANDMHEAVVAELTAVLSRIPASDEAEEEESIMDVAREFAVAGATVHFLEGDGTVTDFEEGPR